MSKTDWPASKVEMRNVSELVPYANNSRTHSPQQVDQIAASINEWGWTVPVLVDEKGMLIAGHARIMAAQKLGIEQVPTMTATGWTEAQKKAYVVADNKLALNADWDTELLSIGLQELQELDFDLELTGFSLDEIEELEPQVLVEGLTDEDDVPELQDDPVTKLGDVWLLGKHRLMCGDSTDGRSVAILMEGRFADLVFTSPPYNANTRVKDGYIFSSKKPMKLYGEGYSDNLPSAEYIDFTKRVLEVCFSVTNGFIFWNVSYNANSRFEYIKQIEDRLPFLIEQICWKKSSTIPLKSSLRRDWEPIYLFSTTGEMLGLDEVVSNFWPISNTNSQADNHKACFPVELPEKGISIVRKKTGIVFDPFGGSGSTLIACEKTGRQARLMEIDPKYCDVIIRRWQDFTGQEAVLEQSGQKFKELEHC